MKANEIQDLFNSFESIAIEYDGVECWSAREFYKERGVDAKGFAIISTKGDRALFGLDTAMMKRRVGAPDKRPLTEFLSTIAIKAKDLAAEMTSVNVRQKDLHGQVGVEREHVDNNSAVRNMLLDRGIRPEALPPREDVKKVERRLEADEKKIIPKKKK